MAGKENENQYDCKRFIMAIHDTMDLIGGKWKVYIIAALYEESKRYSDILRDIKGISGKMLSRELKEMEINQLVRRRIIDTKPVTAQYELTEYGQTLKSVIHTLADWGTDHRRKITGKEPVKFNFQLKKE